ncbi:unnamed protein product [Dibothriocephalus latus]|uniref:Peptidase A1 domain-containing protein n=1 Tax=Dibothriocephalus latus TaxID=60516 RepID=A0A3P6SW68_DIBLA|nr:unnamed protein product [Dibothriocephalus latus]
MNHTGSLSGAFFEEAVSTTPDSKWCEKAADSLRDVFDVRDRSPKFGAPVDEAARVIILSEYPSKVFYLGNFNFWFAAVRLNMPIGRPYATAFVADWVASVVIQYLHRVCHFPEYFNLKATTVFATDEDIKEGQLAVARSQGQLQGQEKSATKLLVQDITVTGKLTLGEAESNHQYQFQTVPVVEAVHFRIVLTDISINGRSLIENCQELNSGLTVLDSGTPNIMLPAVVYSRFKKELLAHFEQAASSLSQSGKDLFRAGAKICQDIGEADTAFPGDVYAAFPTLEFDVLAQTGLDPQILRLSLSAQQYLRYVGRSNIANANRDCFTLAIGASPNADLLLGMSFLEGFEVLFNRQDKKVGFRTSDCVSYTQYPNLPNSRVVGVYQWNSAGDKSSPPEQCSPLLISKQNVAKLDALGIILIVFSVFVFLILCGALAFFLHWRRNKGLRVAANADGDKSEIEI